jgi:hypothetical protein
MGIAAAAPGVRGSAYGADALSVRMEHCAFGCNAGKVFRSPMRRNAMEPFEPPIYLANEDLLLKRALTIS